MWGIALTALRWLGTVALGWTVSDVYNETQTTKQSDAASVTRSTWTSIANKWQFYAGLFVFLLVGAWILKKLNILKIGKK
jgi:hypothetical protein